MSVAGCSWLAGPAAPVEVDAEERSACSQPIGRAMQCHSAVIDDRRQVASE